MPIPMFTRDVLEYLLACATETNYTKLEGKALLRLEDGEGAIIATPCQVVVCGGYNARKPGKSAIIRAAEELLPTRVGQTVSLAVLTAAAIDSLFGRPIGGAAKVIVGATADGGIDLDSVRVEWVETR